MNTNDFYKELFEKYALDEDKIRRNAIKAAKTPAWQRAVSAHWKSAVGAAAAVAVTVGAVAYTVGNSTGSVDIDSSENLPTAYQRLREAEQDYYNAAVEDESRTNIYVTFLEDICFSDMAVSLSALPDYDEIDIECLYLSDSTVIRGKAEVDAYAETSGSNKNIAGAKLYAPLRCYRDIQDLSKVYLAELGSQDINDDTFSPIDYDDEDPLKFANDIIVTTTESAATTTPFSFAGETSVTSVSSTSAVSSVSDADADTTAPVIVDDTEDTEDTEPVEDPTDVEDVENNESTDVSEEAPVETSVSDNGSEEYVTTDITSETTVDASEITDAPDVGLMTKIYQLNVENALETLLVGDNAVVLTRNEVYVYKLGGIMNGGASVYPIASPKIAHSDNNTVIITGCGSNGRRNSVLTIETKSGNAFVKDAGEIFGDAEIGTIHYSVSDGKYILKAVSESKTYLFELTIGGEENVQFRPLLEFAGAVSTAGYRNGRVWFTAADETLRYNLYSFDCLNGVLRVEYNFGTECRIRRSRTFGSFLITASDFETGEIKNYVFDVDAGALIQVDISGDAAIAVQNGVIYIGQNGRNYSVSPDGTLTESGAQVSFISKPYSTYSVVSSDTEKIVVAENNGWS